MAPSVAAMAGRLSRMFLDRGTHTASVHSFPFRRVTYSNHTDPTGTRQFPPGLPRKASQTLPSAPTASLGKHGAIDPRGPAGCRAPPPPPPRALRLFAPALRGIASITSGGANHFPSVDITRIATPRPVW